MTTHVVMFSGGVGSWATAMRVYEQTSDRVVLLFADTKVEDADTYRFLRESAATMPNAELVEVADGRTPFEVFHDHRFLGNSRLAHCSIDLKQKPCREWIEANCDPATTTLYVGIDWTETHRLPAIEDGWLPYTVKAPLADPDWPITEGDTRYPSKKHMCDRVARFGVEPPAAYAAGFPHANCMAQGCVRGGQAYWQHILRTKPDVYADTEAAEQGIRTTEWGENAAMLRDRTGGTSTPLTLRQFRERIEAQPEMFDTDEWGGCGCFTEGQA